MTYLKSYIAVDFETSGLDSEKNEIIEIGAARFVAGQVKGKYQSLVQPDKEIPFAIEKLTGITNKELKKARPLSLVLPEFLDFIGNAPIVFHNAAFDSSFLQKAMDSFGFGRIKNTIYDSLHFSRVLLPFIKSHSLKFLSQYYNIELVDAHRAYNDALATGLMFWQLLEYMRNYENPDFIHYMLAVSDNLDWINKDIFENAGVAAALGSPDEGRKLIGEDRNYYKKENDIPDDTDPISTIADFFGSDGKLSQVLGNFEHRESQSSYAVDIYKALRDNRPMMLEAGTGIGKTLAYLIPSIIYGNQNDENVCISTNTKNLQEQIFNKEIPFLHNLFNKGFSAAIIKGRNNYICHNKFYKVLQSADRALTNLERIQLLTIIKWFMETNTGDIEGNTSFDSNRALSLWSKLVADSNTCLGKKCRYYKKCFVFGIRRKAAACNILVANQSYMLSDLALENGTLAKCRNFVIDEAHNFESNAIGAFSSVFSYKILMNVLNRLHNQRKDMQFGFFARLKSTLLFNDSKTLPIGLNSVGEAVEKVESLKKYLRDFFKKINKLIIKEKLGLKYRLKPGRKIFTTLSPMLEEVKSNIVVLVHILKTIDSHFKNDLDETMIDEYESFAVEINASYSTMKTLLDTLDKIITCDDNDYVYWIEKNKIDTVVDIDFIAAPVSVGNFLQNRLYEGSDSVIYTSATLCMDDDFMFFRERLGLQGQANLATGKYTSPFDYRNNAALILPDFVPDLYDPSYTQVMRQILSSILNKHRLGTLVLFTSYSILFKMFEQMRDELSANDILLLAQGVNGKRNYLIEQFKDNKSSVLFGTSSFWEGIDVPGGALEQLVLVKLPFPVPTDPIVEAQMEYLKEKGMDAFMNYMLPMAVLKFKQGFGRLIRHKDDKGIVLCFDNRLYKKMYGKRFLNSIPADFHKVSNLESLNKFIGDFM